MKQFSAAASLVVNALIIIFMSFMLITPVLAGEVKIVDVKAFKRGESWHFNVTLKHDDTGWDHYADEWRVVTEDGEILGDRILYHPHVDEQPFTRGLSGVKIPPEIKKVYIEAHDKVHGWSKGKYTVFLEQ